MPISRDLPERQRRDRLLWGALAGVAFVAMSVLDVAFLDAIPWGPTLDDGAYAAAGYSFVRTGHAGLPMGKGLFGLDRDLVMYGRIPAAAVGLAQVWLGVSSFADRLPSLLAVCVTAGLVLGIAWQCNLGWQIALPSALLWHLSIPARMLAHSGRPDSFLMLFTLGAVLLLLRGLKRHSNISIFLAGVVAGLSLETHMIGGALMATLAVSAFLLSTSGTRWKNAVLVCLGAAPGIIVWCWIHVLSQQELWALQWGKLWRYWSPLPLSDGPAAIAASAWQRYRSWFWDARYHRYLFELPFLAIGVGAALWRSAPERSLAVVFVIFHVLLASLASAPHAGYMFAVYPLACILIVCVFWRSRAQWLRLAFVCLLAFHLLQAAYWIGRPDRPLPAQLTVDVRDRIGARPFLSGDNLWFHFSGHDNFRSVVAVNFMRFYAPETPWAEAFQTYLRREEIQFFVMDRVFQEFLTPSQRSFLEQHGALIWESDYGSGRWIKIYRLRLPGGP